MVKKLLISSCCWLAACATTTSTGPGVGHGFSTAIQGVGHLLLSPLQVATGLLEGIASVPYYLSTNLNEINQGLVNAQANVTLGDTYQSVYGKSLAEVPASGDTGKVFKDLPEATQFFQKILREYQVPNAYRYILTSLSSDQYVLLTVVYRSADSSIQVFDKHDRRSKFSLGNQDSLFYVPYRQDVNGQPLDTVIDWAALPKTTINTQKAQAVLLTLATNSVLSGKKSPTYWEIENRWLAGAARAIVQEQENSIKARMGI